MKAVLGNYPTSLIHDGNDKIDDIEERKNKRCYFCKWRKILASLGYVVTSSFVATNNEEFKILKDMVDFYLRYKKLAIQCRCNQTTLNGFFSKD